MIPGADVSHWHPVTNWGLLANACRFLGIKATEGETNVDPSMVLHRNGFRASSLDIAVYYHLARPGDPVAQAQRFAAAVGPLQANERLCLDVERSSGVSMDFVNRFYGALMGDGADPLTEARPLIYVSAGGWRDVLGNPTWDLAKYVDLWIPRYGPAIGDLPRPWSTWAVWQYSESAQTPGVTSPNDANWWNPVSWPAAPAVA